MMSADVHKVLQWYHFEMCIYCTGKCNKGAPKWTTGGVNALCTTNSCTNVQNSMCIICHESLPSIESKPDRGTD